MLEARGSAAPGSAVDVLAVHPSSDLYGSDLQFLESLRAFAQAGLRVHVTVGSQGPLVEELPDDVDVRAMVVVRKDLLRTLRGPIRLLHMLDETLRIAWRLRRQRPGLVYVNTVTIPQWVVAARLARVPVLVHVHEAEAEVRRLLRVLIALPLMAANRVVVNSQASRRVLIDSLPRLQERTAVVLNGVPDSGALPPPAAAVPTVAYIGRLSPRKGVDVLLEACARLRAEGLAVNLLVCGSAFRGYEWFERELMSRAGQQDLAGSVHFLGYVRFIRPVLAQSSVLAIPSRVEPLGNVAIEGQLAARPVIASDVGGLAEIISSGQSGLLVPRDDPGALAEAIGSVLRDPGLARRLSAQARDSALARFSLERYRAELMSECRSVGRI